MQEREIKRYEKGLIDKRRKREEGQRDVERRGKRKKDARRRERKRDAKRKGENERCREGEGETVETEKFCEEQEIQRHFRVNNTPQ